jgi:protein associated with RNAse G/E
MPEAVWCGVTEGVEGQARPTRVVESGGRDESMNEEVLWFFVKNDVIICLYR